MRDTTDALHACVASVITRAIQQKIKELEKSSESLKSFRKVLALFRLISVNKRMVSPHRANMAWRLKQVLVDGIACPLSRSEVSLLSRYKNYGSMWNRNIGVRPCVSGIPRILGLQLHTYSAVLMQRNKTGSENSGGNQKEKLLPSGLITTPQNIQVRNTGTDGNSWTYKFTWAATV